jgi:hypothetical protein
LPSIQGIVCDSAKINTNTATTLKSGSGVLHRVIVQNAGTGWTLTFFDNTAASGDVIFEFVTSQGAGVYEINAEFGTGLTVAGTGTAGVAFVYWA